MKKPCKLQIITVICSKIKISWEIVLLWVKERLSEGKKNIIADLIREYDIQSAEYIQDALKDLIGGTIESMLTD